MKEPWQIKNMDSWNQFFKSGRVEDYLHYVSQASDTKGNIVGNGSLGGEGSHAGFDSGHRYNTETDAYR